jgi:hypothetical protein
MGPSRSPGLLRRGSSGPDEPDSGCGCRFEPTEQRRQQGADAVGIELGPSTLYQLTQGMTQRQRRTVGPDARHCIERVCYRHDAGFKRDCLGGQAVGKAGAVEPLVVRSDDCQYCGPA